MLGFVSLLAADADSPPSETAPVEKSESANAEPPTKPNVLAKTLGGREFWGDVRHFHDWRIQHNVITGHYRLLDGKDVRHAWGTHDECQTKLEDIRREQKLPHMSGDGVILIHGIIRSSKSMSAFREPLEKAGFRVFPFDYPSTRVELDACADYLHQVIESLEGIERLHIVAHSMGGIVTRTYWSKHRDPRLTRAVFIGSPHNGAELADLMRSKANFLFKPILGPSGQQLITDAEGFVAKLPTPDCEFAIIAGSHPPKGFNPLIPGDNDGIVSLASTRLAGAADFMAVDLIHVQLIRSEPVIRDVTQFLLSGRLRETGAPQPIRRE